MVQCQLVIKAMKKSKAGNREGQGAILDRLSRENLTEDGM